ncbi:short-chain dehydrogenase/reductase [Burkholderia sp. BCC1993]|uniref:short-chain dehydrogenase/reductase n=1 Tax=Burkholderia sp. BCC1993 TaxID=2817444 RepID=UPI002AB0A91B|nr:short-chain dehydrogenase/reductase [Burkholderia sp. BCC1993]
MDLQLRNKAVLVTGGSRGIGFACAKSFIAEGASVTITGRSATSVSEAKRKIEDEYKIEVSSFVGDLSQSTDRERLYALHGDVDILVNNAGAIPGSSLSSVDEDTWRQAWDLKVFGDIDIVRHILPRMMTRRSGVVVNVIGIAGEAPRYDYLCGSTGNAALSAFTRAVGARSTANGVRVVGVHPGPTETRRLVSLSKARAAEKFGDESRWHELLTHLPFGRAARPDEISDVVVYLSSHRASYLSGVIVDADGGARYKDD